MIRANNRLYHNMSVDEKLHQIESDLIIDVGLDIIMITDEVNNVTLYKSFEYVDRDAIIKTCEERICNKAHITLDELLNNGFNYLAH